MSFVHLHVHTQYSLLEGAIRIPALMERVKALGQTAVAITDTHNLFGAIDFYTSAKAAGIKPIIGCEILYAEDGYPSGFENQRSQGNFKPHFHHLVLLCKNLKGYQNLCQMISKSYLDAPQAKKGSTLEPRTLISRKLLDEFGEGLIVLSGCLRGELAVRILWNENDLAESSLVWFKNRFGDDFYLELQETGLPEQTQVNDRLFEWGKKYGVKSVATSDCHYLDPKDAEAHEILQCIDHGRNLEFDRPKSFVPENYFLKSAQDMAERFSRYPGAVEMTLEIANKCDLNFKFKDDQGRPIYHLPKFRPQNMPAETEPGGEYDLNRFFAEESEKGLEKRLLAKTFEEKRASPQWEQIKQEYKDRLSLEIRMIQNTGFAGYFLIVSDFIVWAKNQGIPVGPGRGSGAGSLVAYSLQITNIDPIEFKLLFERFINPERVSMPDFDIDFCQERRAEVIQYVGQRYGKENVCQIITFGKLQTKACIKDVCRVLGLSFQEADVITKLIPEELNIKIKDAIAKEPRLQELIETQPKVARIFEYALTLEGLYRNAGVHAAGVIITENPVVTYCPLYKSGEGEIVSQFDKDICEKIGLIKFDFLGLKTLTVINTAAKLIQASAKPGSIESDFTIEEINWKDPKVFELFRIGATNGIFQVESDGMKDLCQRLVPSSIEDLTAINALYRPGPLGSGMVDDFIDRKHGRKPMHYPHPLLEEILKETYGVILYQEQVMQIARELAGYSLGQADLLRRAMGKKKAEEMAEHRSIFVKGAIEKQIPPAKAEEIFSLMEKFAEYGFNKSHSAAYAVITYQTAFLKTHYLAEFMAALMTTEMSNTDKITKYIADARAHAMPVLAPSVNLSQRHFSVEENELGKKSIRFGLEAIKGVGGIAVDILLEARELTPFKNVLDFSKRVSARKVNKKVLESLILAGAFEDIGEVNRATLFASIEKIIEYAQDEQEEQSLGQTSLFENFSAEEMKLFSPGTSVFKEEADWPLARKLLGEKQVVGFYVSGHPMENWQSLCDQWLGCNSEKLKKIAENAPPPAPPPTAPKSGEAGGGAPTFRFQAAPKRKEIKIAGILSEYYERTTKKGARMAFGKIEDLYGSIELVFFPKSLLELTEKLKQMGQAPEPVVFTAELGIEEGGVKLFVNQVEWAKDVVEGKASRVLLKLNAKESKIEQLRELKKAFFDHRGKCLVELTFEDSSFLVKMNLPKSVKVDGTPKTVASINKIFGSPVATLEVESKN